ncbi:MAG: hypothetical protein PHF00_08015, partial [Elusimicrobia bacterium]|nr:hypothetical protein [Elusimicrobiota bacterium]
LGGARESVFTLRLDPGTLALLPADAGEPPEWTRLGNRKCPHCPLAESSHRHCPVARNLAPVVAEFGPRISFEEADISILTAEREYRRRAPLQAGVSSLMGAVMAASGCPHLDMLRPMVCTHLPFASIEETVYRAISMYLMAQYFRSQRGLAPDWDLTRLVSIYEAVGLVNRSFVERLRTIQLQDAALNALVKLDCFASITSAQIAGKALQGVEGRFAAYLASGFPQISKNPSR